VDKTAVLTTQWRHLAWSNVCMNLTDVIGNSTLTSLTS